MEWARGAEEMVRELAAALPFAPALALAIAVAAVVLAMTLVRLRGLKEQAVQQQAGHEAQMAALRADLDDERRQTAEGRVRIEGWIGEKTAAQIRLAETEQRLATAIAERDHAHALRDLARDEARQAQREAALRAQQLDEIEKRLADWETAKTESLQAARAAVLSTATELSSKLLEDHKRETAEARKEAEERVRKATEDLFRRMEDVTKSVAVLDRQVDATRDRMETVWKALSSPGGAGRFAEIGLENTLRSFGLEKGRDYLVQAPVEGSRLRPDAMVLLPGDAVLVIDSKASKHLLDLAAAEGGPDEEEAWRGIARTMSAHLKSLADKNYRGEILAGYRQAGRSGAIQRIVSVMYLPNEGALEKLRRADPEFTTRARRCEISIAGPEALGCLIAFASIQIDFARRIDNQEQIVEATQGLLDSICVVVEHVEKLGRGLRAAATSYVDLVGSMNGRLLPRARGIIAKGVKPARSKPLRDHLPVYQLVQMTGDEVIDGEVEMLTAQTLPEKAGVPA